LVRSEHYRSDCGWSCDGSSGTEWRAAVDAQRARAVVRDDYVAWLAGVHVVCDADVAFLGCDDRTTFNNFVSAAGGGDIAARRTANVFARAGSKLCPARSARNACCVAGAGKPVRATASRCGAAVAGAAAV